MFIQKYISILFSISNFESINFTYLMLKWIGRKYQPTHKKKTSTQIFSRARIIRFFSKRKLSPNTLTWSMELLCMLMEILCYIRSGAKEDIGLSFHQSYRQTLHSCIQFEVKHGKSITCKLFSCRFMCAKFKFGLSARPANTRRSS